MKKFEQLEMEEIIEKFSEGIYTMKMGRRCTKEQYERLVQAAFDGFMKRGRWQSPLELRELLGYIEGWRLAVYDWGGE
jgi:hypothetical protein